MAYSKLHSSIVNSSLWTQPDAVRILFITLLALCDRDGIVYGSRLGLERIAMIDSDSSDFAWEALMSPDSDSSDKMRAPENEGRRIEEVPGGFRLLNFEYYRGLRNDDDRREQNRVAQAKFKAKVSQGKPASSKESRDNPISEAEAEAEAEPPISPKGEGLAKAELIYEVYPKKVGKPSAIKAIMRAMKKQPADFLLQRTREFAAARNGDLDFCPHPATWFNQERFNDDQSTWERSAPAKPVDRESLIKEKLQLESEISCRTKEQSVTQRARLAEIKAML